MSTSRKPRSSNRFLAPWRPSPIAINGRRSGRSSSDAQAVRHDRCPACWLSDTAAGGPWAPAFLRTQAADRPAPDGIVSPPQADCDVRAPSLRTHLPSRQPFRRAARPAGMYEMDRPADGRWHEEAMLASHRPKGPHGPRNAADPSTPQGICKVSRTSCSAEKPDANGHLNQCPAMNDSPICCGLVTARPCTR